MTVISVNPIQTVKSGIYPPNKPFQKTQSLSFGRHKDSYENSGKNIAKRVITEGAVGGIIGLGLGLLYKHRGIDLLKSAGINALFFIGISELFNLIEKPVSKVVDSF